MRAVSLKSLKSDGGRSEMGRSVTASEDGSQHVEFDDFLMTSIKKFNCPVSVLVRKEILRGDTASIKSGKREKQLKYKRKSIVQPLANIPSVQLPSEPSDLHDDHTLLVITYYDVLNQMVEILMSKYHYQPIPRMLMQLIALKVPFTRYLTKFTIKQCSIDMYTIHELSKILLLTNITDVCLDHSPVKEGNYDILLADASSIRNLSLSRCRINDIVCERIAARLRHLEPAETTLKYLNLSSNNITDVGMKHLGEALRTNRHLRYLNLADNRIGDIGARYIFDVLKEFPLTFDEILDKGKRYLEYLKRKHVLYLNCMEQLCNKSDENIHILSKKSSKKGTSGKSRPSMKRDKNKDLHLSEDSLRIKAETLALQILGPFKDPFTSSTVIVKDRISYSIGNLVLCYINFAYNNLSFESVEVLLNVIQHQRNYRDDHLCGLLYVTIEGNYVPAECDEYKDINKELLLARLNLKKHGHSNRTGEKVISTSSR